jgi:superfamily II DNA or RNA helicase
MREGEIQGLIASTIADEGLDIKRLAGLILAGGGKSSTRALQRVGRTLRTFEGKTHAIVVDMADESKYLRVHSSKRKEIYLTEPEFVILET